MTFIIGTPHTHNAGYFRNDDTPSGGTLSEADVQTCPHCQKVIKMQEWRAAPIQNFCLKCMKPTCEQVGCQECIPYIKRVDMVFDALVKYQDHLRMAGLEPVSPAPQIFIPG